MNMKIDYFDNKLEIGREFVNVIEIENKKYFYRFIRDIKNLVLEGYSSYIKFFDENFNEKNMNNKIKVFIDFFELGFSTKKNLNDITKYAIQNIEEKDKCNLINQYNNMMDTYKEVLNSLDIQLEIDEELGIENILKNVKVSIKNKDGLLDNLLLLVDLDKVLVSNDILIFVNLKQYLSKEELIELYKYSIYNQITILLVDSQSYGTTLEYEKKLIIDENLDEFVL